MNMQEFDQLYRQKLHAIQSATLYEIERDGEKEAGADPKHLRTGLSCVMTDLGSVVKLLLQKGLITEEEMFKAILDGLDEELVRCHSRLGLPDNISFG